MRTFPRIFDVSLICKIMARTKQLVGLPETRRIAQKIGFAKWKSYFGRVIDALYSFLDLEHVPELVFDYFLPDLLLVNWEPASVTFIPTQLYRRCVLACDFCHTPSYGFMKAEVIGCVFYQGSLDIGLQRCSPLWTLPACVHKLVDKLVPPAWQPIFLENSGKGKGKGEKRKDRKRKTFEHTNAAAGGVLVELLPKSLAGIVLEYFLPDFYVVQSERKSISFVRSELYDELWERSGLKIVGCIFYEDELDWGLQNYDAKIWQVPDIPDF